MSWICQKELPPDMLNLRALPGVQPLDMADWLVVDDVYAAQMCERLRLLNTIPDKVMAKTSDSSSALEEACAMVIEQVQKLGGFEKSGEVMTCPDGRDVALTGDPLHVMGQLIQEDICIMQRPEDAEEHFLSAAVLCFPAHWTLSEKIGRSMGRIHKPVDIYTDDIQRRVQRLFDGVQVGRPLWRFNRAHAGPELYQPRSELEFKNYVPDGQPEYVRAERQSLIRLPESKAVIFSIHTYVVAPCENEKA